MAESSKAGIAPEWRLRWSINRDVPPLWQPARRRRADRLLPGEIIIEPRPGVERPAAWAQVKDLAA